MIKLWVTVILFLFFISFELSYAQSAGESSKIYFGFLHQMKAKKSSSFLHDLFHGSPQKKEMIVENWQCSIEFISSAPFSHQSVAVVPQELKYFIKFNDPSSTAQDATIKQKYLSSKLIIKVYTNDDQEYTIDPDKEGKGLAFDQEHHIFDSYLIYLVLGTGIDHLEVLSSNGDDQDRYVLDKLEIHDAQ